MQVSPCVDENELLEFADNVLPESRRLRIAEHVDECTSCRAMLAEIVRRDPSTPTRPATDKLPPALLDEYLKRDTPIRELKICCFVAGVMAMLILMMLLVVRVINAHFATRAAAVEAALLVYELTGILFLRRGFCPRWLPYANSLVEVSFIFAMQLLALPALGPEGRGGAGLILLGALIVFSALRNDPRLCLVVGAVAGSEQLALDWLAPTAVLRGHAIREGAGGGGHALFCVFAGVAGFLLARYQVSRARAALKEIRETDLFGKYLLHEKLGQGGMGEVFRATYCPEGGFVRTVAVKRVRSDRSADPGFAEAFKKEVELGAQLVHPNLVQLLDCGKFRGNLVVAMELVDGMSLQTLLRRLDGPLAIAAVSYVGAALCAALEYVHQKRGADGRPLGLVHCDLNPPNVLISRIGEVKLTDFGVARAGDMNQAGSFGGKCAYASPEQLRGEPLDGRSDLFALGLTLHEALTGRPAISADADALTVTLAPRSSSRADLPIALDEIIMRLLKRDREDRPRDAATVRAQLLGLDGSGAPYPHGERLLMLAVESVLRVDRPPSETYSDHRE